MIFGEESEWASNVLHFTDWAEVVFSWSLPLHYKSKEKALLCKAFPVFMIFTYTSFDCVDHRPTTFNFCILSRFSSSEACTYRSNVIVTEVCPNISDNDLTSNPTSTARVANVWRSVWKCTPSRPHACVYFSNRYCNVRGSMNASVPVRTYAAELCGFMRLQSPVAYSVIGIVRTEVSLLGGPITILVRAPCDTLVSCSLCRAFAIRIALGFYTMA